MNPFNFFKTYATSKGVEEFEKRLTEFLINNRLFQHFAHRSEATVKDASEKILRKASKVGNSGASRKEEGISRGGLNKLKP